MKVLSGVCCVSPQHHSISISYVDYVVNGYPFQAARSNPCEA